MDMANLKQKLERLDNVMIAPCTSNVTRSGESTQYLIEAMRLPMNEWSFKKNLTYLIYFMLAWISVLLMHSVNVLADQEKTMIYWTSSAGIQRADLNGESYETLLSVTLSNPQSIAVDAVRGKIYWTDRGSRKIQRANLNGTNVEDLVSTSESSFLFGIAIDPIREKVYWADGGWPRKIQRANLDGSNVEDFITDRNTADLKLPRAVTIDVDRGKVYWRDSFSSRILRVDLDGTNVERVVTSGYTVEISHVAVADEKIYWASYDWPSRSGEVKRANLDGSNEELITTIKHIARSIAVDILNDKIYWKEYNQSSETGTIYRANLDGTNVEQLISIPGLDTPNSIALNPLEGKLYWIDSFTTDLGTTGIIRWANLDGTAARDLINTKLRSPCGLAIDDKAGKIYWTDFGTDKIQRANLDGTRVEDLITTGLSAPISLALDQLRGKIYWANWKTGSLQRANLDGTHVEDILISSPKAIRAIAVNAVAGRIYWTGSSVIQYSDLDGTNAGTLLSGLGRTIGIDIDANQGKIYWTENGFSKKVRRANLDGTAPEDVVTYPRDLALATDNLLRGITVDSDSSLVYWADGWPDLHPEIIKRVESNGNNVVRLLTGIVEPRFVALGPATVSNQVVSVDVSGKLATLWGRVRQNALLQNFPNPFNPETWIPYQLSEESEVRLMIYNVKGERIRTISLGKKPAGVYMSKQEAIHWDGRNDKGEPVGSGEYFYTIQAGEYTDTRKMLLLK